MNLMGIVITITMVLLAVEALFFLAIYRWLADGRRRRERDFAILDRERNELLKLQGTLKQDVAAAQTLARETVEKLTLLGAQVNAEWTDVEAKLQTTLSEVSRSTQETLDSHVERVVRHKMALEKAVHEARHHEQSLGETLKKAERLLRFFDRNVSVDDVLKDIQTEKYAEARTLMDQGVEASTIARKLGLSLNEVVLLSHIR